MVKNCQNSLKKWTKPVNNRSTTVKKNPAYGRQSISRPMRIVAPIPQQGGPRMPDFFEKWKKLSKTQKLKNIKKYAKISDTPFDQRSLIHGEAWFPPCFVRQNQPFLKHRPSGPMLSISRNVHMFVCLSVCLSVCVFTFQVPFNGLFAPTSQSRMTKIFRDSKSLGKSAGKKWSQN